MNHFKIKNPGNRGGAAIEFAFLLPIWLIIFFGMLDYSWYLINLMIMENAVATGARAGVKIQYWSEDEAGSPAQIAMAAVKHAFWLDRSLKDKNIQVYITDENNDPVDVNNTAYKDYKYLEVRVIDYQYPLLAGYLSASMLPRSISAVSSMAFP